MKAPHTMAPEERRESVLRSLDEARHMAAMNERFADSYAQTNPALPGQYALTGQGWRRQEAYLKGLRILAFTVALAAFTAAAKPTPTEVVAAVLIAEAGGERDPARSMRAVREVIQMRAWQQQRTELAVVTAPRQFSCLNRTTTARLVAAAKSHPQWPAAARLAAAPVAQATVWQANHYHAATINPAWAKGARPIAIVGGHYFYRL